MQKRESLMSKKTSKKKTTKKVEKEKSSNTSLIIQRVPGLSYEAYAIYRITLDGDKITKKQKVSLDHLSYQQLALSLKRCSYDYIIKPFMQGKLFNEKS